MMSFQQIFAAARECLDEEHLLLDMLQRELAEATGKIRGNPANWQEVELAAEVIPDLFESVTHMLWMRATAIASSTNDPVYQEATDVAEAIRTVIANHYRIEFDEARITSPSVMLAEAGFAELSEGPDGETLIRLTPTGEAVVQFVEDELDCRH